MSLLSKILSSFCYSQFVFQYKTNKIRMDGRSRIITNFITCATVPIGCCLVPLVLMTERYEVYICFAEFCILWPVLLYFFVYKDEKYRQFYSKWIKKRMFNVWWVFPAVCLVPLIMMFVCLL